MGTRGPLKVPAHLAAVPDPSAEPESVQDLSPHEAPAKPDSVRQDEELSQLWDEIVEPLNRTGFLSPGDGPVLETLCRHMIMLRRMYDDLELNGLMIPSPHDDYLVKNPLLQNFGMSSDRIMEIAKQLGMTWMTRARTPLQEKPSSGDGNPFAATGS
jgi:P27 family predicted phage terminase small subunit